MSSPDTENGGQFAVVPVVTTASIASTIVLAAAKVVAAAMVLAATFVSVTIATRRLGLVDSGAPTVEILAVHPLNCIPHGLLVDEGDESEAAGPLGPMIVNDLRV
ncbi:hypothetical protein CRG98_040331 [Punica granatum]|uniref:Uncharacterized protein n=1 Tax=Punica granatum TaxID=22663 RepID=A0A2I0I5K0_PUNGR|nr:hypothetical protein CRG98_040331 [Punica granatum]